MKRSGPGAPGGDQSQVDPNDLPGTPNSERYRAEFGRFYMDYKTNLPVEPAPIVI